MEVIVGRALKLSHVYHMILPVVYDTNIASLNLDVSISFIVQAMLCLIITPEIIRIFLRLG
jgi:hypothetical protein